MLILVVAAALVAAPSDDAVVDKDTSMAQLIVKLEWDTGAIVTFDPQHPRFHNKVGRGFVPLKLPRRPTLAFYRAILAFYEIHLVKCGNHHYKAMPTRRPKKN